MKKILIFLLSAVSAASLAVSCSKDAVSSLIMTDDRKNEIAESDPDKVYSAAMAGMYSDVQSYYYTDTYHNYFGQKSFDYLTSLMGNDMVMTGRFGMSIYHYLLDYWGEGYVPTSNRWHEYYNMISNCNIMIAGIAEDETDPNVLKYLAQAMGLRGYAYYQLTLLYQFPYYMGVSDNKWGGGDSYADQPCVPIVTDKITGNQPRSTVAEVHRQIIDDLKGAYDIFVNIGAVKTATPSDFDGCVAATYLARVYMTQHDWSEAAKYAQVVMDNFGVLNGEAQILQGFSDLSLPDVVWGCDITTDNTMTYMSWFSQMDAYGDGYAGIGVWRAGFKPFVDRIGDNDIRLWWFECSRTTDGMKRDYANLPESKKKAEVAYQSYKFIGTGRANIQSGVLDGWELGDYIYLRSEEAYLTKAEALAQQGDLTGATSLLVSFMQTRDPSYSFTAADKASLVEEINFQKRVEFWGEGMEFIDNRRLNIPVDRTDATWGAANNNHFDAAKFRYEQSDKHFRYQLPTAEIENNTELTDNDQNEGAE